jgi:glycosyltransferase involved in cell wall biosynthesis
LKVVVVHYHWRPGGVRRIVELAVPHIVRAFAGRVTRVTLAGGEAPDLAWLQHFITSLAGLPVEVFVEPAFGYFSEQRRGPAAIRARVLQGLNQLLADPSCLVWAHNLGLARNLILSSELVRACEARGIRLLAHHHDWWFDQRWQRWPELRLAGFRTLALTAQAVFGAVREIPANRSPGRARSVIPRGVPDTQHLAINQLDAAVLKKHLGERATWQPNLLEPGPEPARERVRLARTWLHDQLETDAPVWLLPCRLLRRKNVAEALLLTRWLRPEAWLVTTGGVSSADEVAYHDRLAAASHAHGWPLRLGMLALDESRKPSVPELLAASECVLLTSIQEGFGLPYLEAAAARRPLIARNLPNIAPDLARFGFRFPQAYDELLIEPSLFDWDAEQHRQRILFAKWKRQLPGAYASQVAANVRKPTGTIAQFRPLASSAKPEPVPFSRLTLAAQLEVLAQPIARSWELCAPLNPFLVLWSRRAQQGKLRVTQWPTRAAHLLSGRAYAERFLKAASARAVTRTKIHNPDRLARALQADFIRIRLQPEYLYPLLWSLEA